MLGLAFLVKGIYHEIYGKDIPIFINKNERMKEVPSNITLKKEDTVSNNLIKGHSIKINKKLEDGIHDIFLYLQNS